MLIVLIDTLMALIGAGYLLAGLVDDRHLLRFWIVPIIVIGYSIGRCVQ